MIPYPLSRPFALLVLLLLAGPLPAAEYAGRVVGVSDGDTMTLLVPDGASFKQVKIRLGEIDTPESKQPYGERAKQTLSDLAFGKPARVVVQDTDKYGRTVGRVYVGNLDVNAEMIGRGAAWVTRKTRRCTGWKTRPRRRSAACGRCRKRNAARLGTGARMRARRQRRRRLHRPPARRKRLPAAVSPAPASGVAAK